MALLVLTAAAHFNVLIKNPAKAAGPRPERTNEGGVLQARGARLLCDWSQQNMESGFTRQ